MYIHTIWFIQDSLVSGLNDDNLSRSMMLVMSPLFLSAVTICGKATPPMKHSEIGCQWLLFLGIVEPATSCQMICAATQTPEEKVGHIPSPNDIPIVLGICGNAISPYDVYILPTHFHSVPMKNQHIIMWYSISMISPYVSQFLPTIPSLYPHDIPSPAISHSIPNRRLLLGIPLFGMM